MPAAMPEVPPPGSPRSSTVTASPRCAARHAIARPIAPPPITGETLGTLTKNGLLSLELVLDWQWVAGIWARVSKAALAQREKYGEPRLYENFEALANAQR